MHPGLTPLLLVLGRLKLPIGGDFLDISTLEWAMLLWLLW